MSMSLLLDTNVWVDNYCSHHASSEVARQLILAAYGRGLTLLYPVGILKDVFYVLGHEFRRLAAAGGEPLSEGDALAIRQVVWGCIDNMCSIATAVGADEGDVWLARKYRKLNGDLGDNMVLAAAQRAGADYIVTSDQGLIRRATTAALTPRDMLAVLTA